MKGVSCVYSFFRRFHLKGKPLYYNTTVVAPITVFRPFSQWDIVSAVCLERKSVITQELTPFEKKYFDYMQQLEFEKSYKSDHEIRHQEDLERAKKLKKGEVEDADIALKETAQDFEDFSIKELSSFKPAPRITDADIKNNQRSTQRKLDQTLLLTVQQKLGNNCQWIFPQAVHVDGETLRQTAERCVREICGTNLTVRFLGNAPVGFYKYKYPKVVRVNGVCGAKVFFFKAHLLKGNVCLKTFEENPEVNDYLWLTHSELKEMVKPVYYKSIQPFLLPEEIVNANEIEHTNQDQNVMVC